MALSAAKITAIRNAVDGARDRRNAIALMGELQSAAVTDLNQDISASYAEAEVQAISDKVDELLAALRLAGLLA